MRFYILLNVRELRLIKLKGKYLKDNRILGNRENLLSHEEINFMWKARFFGVFLVPDVERITTPEGDFSSIPLQKYNKKIIGK